MCNKINFETLCLDHLVLFQHEETVFACGKEADGKTRIFLAFGNKEGAVYARNGRAESWRRLEEQESIQVRQHIELAQIENIPRYIINGSSREFADTTTTI